MIGYVTLGTNDLAKAAVFYDAIAAELGVPRMMEFDNFIAWGKEGGGAGIGLTKPFDGNVATVGNGVMVALEASDTDQVQRLYDIALAQKDRSMAAVELEDVRRDLMQYGWIKDARVSRRLPDTLVVDIVERTPAAIWQNDGRLSLIDDSGVVLEPVTVATMPDLPLVIGPNANRRAQDLDALLAEASSLKELLAGATWVGNRRWDLRFRSGETLSLPEGDAEAKAALAKFAHMDGANRLLGRGILRFDMRDPSRFVLRMPHEGQVAPSKIDDARAAADAVSAGQANEG